MSIPEELAVSSSALKSASEISDFQVRYEAALVTFRNKSSGIEATLKKLEHDTGLEYYDRTDDLETFLKNVVNLNRETLSYTDTITDNLPIVGPLLGPSELSLQPSFDVNPANCPASRL